jgi:hypothetical protein
MTAAVVDLTIEQGATFAQLLIWKDSAGSLINLTGYTARMQIRPTVDSDTVIASLTTENGGISLSVINGSISLSIPAAYTALMTFVTAVYDLEMIATDATVTRLIQGAVVLSKEVTR